MPGAVVPLAVLLTEAGLSAVTAVTVAEIGVTLAVVGGVVGMSALQKSLQPDLGTPLSALNAPEVKASVKQSTPAQRIVYGPQRFGGAFAFYKAPAHTGKLYIQHMYSRRMLSAITGLNINGNKLQFTGAGFDGILSPIAQVGLPDYPGKLRVCFQRGTIDQPINPLLAAGFPLLPADWRLPGIANAVYECAYGADATEFQSLWGNVQIPTFEVEALGAPVYDPRDPTQSLPADPNNQAEWFAAQLTWKYSANAALIQADYLWQPDGLKAGPTGIRWDKVAEAADRADEVCGTRDTATTGVFEKRYQVGGVITSDQQAVDVFDGLLTASRSVMVQGNDGTCWPGHDKPKTPVFTITDDMLLGAVSYRAFKGRHDLANETTMRFVAPGEAYQVADGPPLIRADLIAADGAPLSMNVNLPFTPSSSMAQRIAKADLLEVRVEASPDGTIVTQGGASWSGALDLRALGLREDDCVQIASNVCPFWNGLYVVDSWKLAFNLSGTSGVGVSLIGYDPTVADNWDPTVDDQLFSLTDTYSLLG
jgi:hypothetical protein